MCHKGIKTNLNGETPGYLCSTHSKKHIPKKRIVNKEKNIYFPVEVCKIIENQRFNKNTRRKDIKKVNKRKKNKNKKIYICNSGVLHIGKLLRELL